MTPGETIVALATPYGFSGLAIVRISGRRALPVVQKTIRHRDRPIALRHRRVVICQFLSTSGVPFDDVVVTPFVAPQSYTGEDLIEISCHGSPSITEEIIHTLCHYGARVARPGEFTQRAFINGKLDLTQAEAIGEMIRAQSIESARISYNNLRGSLSARVNLIREALIQTLSKVEFELDISEEEFSASTVRNLQADINHLLKTTKQLLDSHQQGKLLTRGAMVVIVGKPNVGKSTLLNALSDSDRAITSHIPGTTRDTVEATVLVRGVPLRFIDTAGIRDTTEPIETEGVRRARKSMEGADLILSLSDQPDEVVATNSFPAPVLKILNKIDLLEGLPPGEVLPVSAKTGLGLDALMNAIVKKLGLTDRTAPAVMITSARQRDLLEKTHHSLEKAQRLFRETAPPLELVSIELRTALDPIDQILGKTTSEEILHTVFSKFCVGK